jgi:CSLREA domain-containing protein
MEGKVYLHPSPLFGKRSLMSKFVLRPDPRLLLCRLCSLFPSVRFVRLKIVLVLAMVCMGTVSAHAAATWTVNTLSDDTTTSASVAKTNCASGNDNTCALRDALLAADSDSGDTIQFSVTGTITVTSLLPPLDSSDMTITGPGANLLTITGPGPGRSLGFVFQVGSAAALPTVSISGLTFANISTATGVIFVSSGSLTVSNCIFTGNSSPNGGAEISIFDSTLTVTGSTFVGKSAPGGQVGGGAISGVDNTLTVTNSTFVGNAAPGGQGGGAISNSGITTVTNSTFVGNSVTSGDGGAISSTGQLTANNNIFSGNFSGSAAQPGVGAGINASGTANGSNNIYYKNLDGVATEDDCHQCTTGSPGSNGNIEATSNPLSLPLGNYGGPTETMLPLPGSAAICAGSSSLVPNGVTTDQRGFPLDPSCAAGSVDVGAVQTNQYVVNSLTDTNDTSSNCDPSGSGTVCSLRDAMDLANTTSGDITFKPGLTSVSVPGTINLGTGTTTLVAGTNTALPSLAGQTNILGPGANQLTVFGNNSNAVGSVLTVNDGATVMLYGLTVSGGNGITLQIAGGIYNSGTLTVMASAISGNTGGTNGGGIRSIDSGTLSVVDSTISGNTATVSGNILGGQATGGGISSTGTLSVVDSTISGNTATVSGNIPGGQATGGGIFSNGGSLTVVNSTISRNTASGSAETLAQGGGMVVISGSASFTLSNSVVAGNIVSGNGAGFADILPDLPDGGSFTGSGDVASTSGSATSAIAPLLSALQYNGTGATVQTMIPLPGSPAICAGATSNIPSGLTTDERGFPLATPAYCTSGQVDAGAVQTNYTSVAFAQQPTDTAVNTAISPTPTVEVVETNSTTQATDTVAGVPVTLNFSGGSSEIATPANLTATTAAVTVGSATVNEAAYSLTPNTIGTGFTLSLGSGGNGITTGSQTFTAASNSFDVVNPVAPTITSPNAVAFPFAASGSFTVTATGSPTPSISSSSCTGGGFSGNHLTFTDNGNGTATISGEVEITLGLPALPGTRFTCTLTASNGVNPTATQTFTLGVEIQLAAVTVVPSTTLTAGTAAPGIQPVAGELGAPAYTYTVSPALPVGLSMNTSSGVISGTPTEASVATIYTVTVTDALNAMAASNFTLTVNAASYVVNTATDPDSGMAGSCTPNAAANSGLGNCSLRDAIAAVNAANGGNITFSTVVFGSTAGAQTITLNSSSGTLTMTGSGVNIAGPGANVLAVSGNNAVQVFNISSGATVSISGMTIKNGLSTSSGGGGIYNNGTLNLSSCMLTGNRQTGNGKGGGVYNDTSGTLTVNQCTLSGNMASGNSSSASSEGGSIYNSGTLTVIGSTLYGNSAGNTNIPDNGFGGAIYSTGTLTIVNSTISGNSASEGDINIAAGGGIDVASGTATLANSIVAGNMLNVSSGTGSNADIAGNYTDSGGNIASNSSSFSSTIDIHLGPLQYNGTGATLQTLVPLPGSPAICAAQPENVPQNLINDERGYPLFPNGGYCTGFLDAGAVQTNYTSVMFNQQPTNTEVNTAMSPSPVAEMVETNTTTGATDAVAGVPLPLYDSNGSATAVVLNATTAAVGTGSNTVNEASYSLTPAVVGAGFTLAAGSTGNGITITTGTVLTATSNSFLVFAVANNLKVSAPASVTAGTAFTVSVTAQDANGTTVATDEDSVSLMVGGTQVGTLTLTNGVGSTTVTLNAAGNVVLTGTDATPSPAVMGTVSIDVLALPLTASISAGNKTYNASTAATVACSFPSGVQMGDVVTCSTANATFATRNVGPGITVTATGLTLSGTNAAKYALTSTTATATANISTAPLTITAATNSKTYDTTTSAATLPTVGASQMQTGDTVTGLAEVYSTPSVGTGKTLSVSAFTVNDGNNGNNYAVTTVQNTTGVITATVLNITANNATKVYGAANPAFTGTVSGGLAGGSFTESFTTTATTSSPVGSYAIVPSVTGATEADYTQTITNGTLMVTKAGSTTTVSASPTAVSPVQTVTLTASVISQTSGAPTGTVTFYNNGTVLMSEPVTAGVAQLTTLLPAGAMAAITATYQGDNNFLTSTSSNSATVVVASLDFTFTNTGTSAYTAAPGAVATYSFALAPLNGSYPGPVSFSVTGLPTGATASFTPGSVAVSGGATPVVMTVQAASATAQNKSNSPFGRGIVLALLLLPFVAKRSVREKMKSRMLLLVLLMAGVTATLTGCGSTNGFLLQSPQTYTLTVTASSGTLEHNQTVTLIAQ